LKRAVTIAWLATATLAGCERPSTGPTINPDSTFRDSAKDRPKPAEPMSHEPRIDPYRKVLQAYPKDDYERAVLYMYEIMYTPDATQAICARWFPLHGRKTADAVGAWQDKQKPLMDEIRDRTRAIWTSQAEGDASVIPRIERKFTNDRYQQFTNVFDQTPTEVYEKRCANLPAALASKEWDLKRRFRQELAIARRRPLNEVMAVTGAP
jgi:hypothetical protein